MEAQIMKFEKINLGSIWTMLTGTVLVVVYMFTNFVSVKANDEFHAEQTASTTEFRVDIYYSQFYELLEKYVEAEDSGNVDFADELLRQLERLKAKICEEDPEWERCKQ